MVKCYPKYHGFSRHIDDVLLRIGCEYTSTYRNYKKRIPLAVANGIPWYTGTEMENEKLVKLARKGKLIIPEKKDERIAVRYMNDVEYESLIDWINDHARYYNMRSICDACSFSYDRFTNWKAGRTRLKTAELKMLKNTMKKISAD